MSIQSLLQIIILLFLSTLTACKTVYGVKEEHWLQLNQAERMETIKGYNQREKIRAESYRAEQQKRAANTEKSKLITAWELQQKKHTINAIYHGKVGVTGDLIRVTVEGGMIAFKGRHFAYQPISFKIADQEEKILIFQRKDGKKKQKIWVRYENGLLWFDIGHRGRRKKHAYTFTYNSRWRRGQRYSNIRLNKHSDSAAKNIRISIENVRHLGWH